MAKLIGFPLC